VRDPASAVVEGIYNPKLLLNPPSIPQQAAMAKSMVINAPVIELDADEVEDDNKPLNL
jgi:hypothetical protein